MNKLFKNCHKIGLEGVFTKLDIYICNYCQYLGSNELLSAARRVATLSSAPSLQIQKLKSVNHFSSHSDRDFFCAHTRPEQAGVEDVSPGRGRGHEGGRGRVDGLQDGLGGHVGEEGGLGVPVLAVSGPGPVARPGVVMTGWPRPGRSQLQSLQLCQDLRF